MPPKPKFSKEEIVSTALEIVREKGIEAVTARELGARLGSSARPIFTVFNSMEDVLHEILNLAKCIYKGYVQQGLKEELVFRGVGSAYIRFAVEEPHLFQLLFMQEMKEVNNINNVLMYIDESYEEILKSVQEPYGLNLDDAKKLYQHLWVYTHGIATLCATKVCMFSADEIQEMLTEVFKGLIMNIKLKA